MCRRTGLESNSSILRCSCRHFGRRGSPLSRSALACLLVWAANAGGGPDVGPFCDLQALLWPRGSPRARARRSERPFRRVGPLLMTEMGHRGASHKRLPLVGPWRWLLWRHASPFLCALLACLRSPWGSPCRVPPPHRPPTAVLLPTSRRSARASRSSSRLCRRTRRGRTWRAGWRRRTAGRSSSARRRASSPGAAAGRGGSSRTRSRRRRTSGSPTTACSTTGAGSMGVGGRGAAPGPRRRRRRLSSPLPA